MMLLPYIGKSIGIHDRHFGYMQTAFGIVQMIGGPLFGMICSRIGMSHSFRYRQSICFILRSTKWSITRLLVDDTFAFAHLFRS